MKPEIVNIRIDSASPLRVRAVAAVDGQIGASELTVEDFRFVVIREDDGSYRLRDFIVTMES